MIDPTPILLKMRSIERTMQVKHDSLTVNKSKIKTLSKFAHLVEVAREITDLEAKNTELQSSIDTMLTRVDDLRTVYWTLKEGQK